MSTAVIKVENLSKAYRLGVIGTGTVGNDLKRWYARVRGKEDPFLKIGETNDRTTKGNSDVVWSLKDINFEIEQGDAVGIIGRNGAGKSTLLKILSRVTSPTTGKITGNGRVASLLEVGTGFNPELSGKDNIYLNGAILGMRKKEIKKRFDEIVDFAGVERYIDTPVKRYSSGMYVRLAFAVAAYLESEILIIDEVLAVGDAEFQKKCLGKMGEVSKGEGRTVLFVSHNMSSVATLTSKAIVLHNGKVLTHARTSDAIQIYQSNNTPMNGLYENKPNHSRPSITKVQVLTSEAGFVQQINKSLKILIEVNMPVIQTGMGLSFQICDFDDKAVVYSYVFDTQTPILRNLGKNRLECIIPNCRLYEGKYYLRVHLAESKGKTYYEGLEKVAQFEMQMSGMIEWGWSSNVCKYVEDFYWETIS